MAILPKPAQTVRRARQLRREMTLPEVLLWQALRDRPSGLKFRHQHPAGPYVLDFYCAAAKLCIEVDGEAHDRANQPARDAERDALLEHHGVKTLRITARDVLSDLDAVIRGILAEAASRQPLHRRSAVPLPKHSLGRI